MVDAHQQSAHCESLRKPMISQGFANGFFVPQGFASFARFSQWAVCRCQGGGETGDEPRACPHSSSGGFGRPSRSVHPLLGLGSALTGNLDPGSSRAFSAIRKLSTGRWRTLMALAGAQGGHSRQATIVLICTDDSLPPLTPCQQMVPALWWAMAHPRPGAAAGPQ